MGKLVVLLTLLFVGYAAAGSASWSEDISVHNNQAVTGIHYSQHESSVNAARRAAAERLQQAASLVAASAPGPCDTLCYNGYAADASDVETIGQGIVGFTSTGTAAGGAVSGASQKYSSSSRVHESTVQNVHTAVPVAVPVYPATATGSRSSFSSSSSSRHHTASQVAQPVLGQQQQLYATHGLEHGRTHSNVVAAGGVREGSYIQPVVYPVIAPVTHSTSQSSYGRSSSVVNQRPATETVYVQVPVVDAAAVSSNSNFNTRSSYVASSDQQQQQHLVQPSHYSNAASTGYANRNEYASQHQDQQYRRYPAKSTTYVLYSKPSAPVGTYYAPSRSHVEDSGSTTYDASGRVVNLAGAQRTLTERTDEQRTQRVQSVHDGRVLVDAGAPLGDTYGDEVDSYVDRSDQQHSLRVASGAASGSQRTEHQQQQQHQYVRTGSYVPTAPVQHTAGTASSQQSRYSSSAHATESQRRQTYQPVVHVDTPLVTHGTTGAGSSVATSEYESTLEQRRQSSGGYVPIAAQPVTSGVASSSSSSNRYQSAHEQRSNTLASGASTSGNPGSGYYNGGVGAAGYGTQYAAKTSSAQHSSSSSGNRYSKAGSPSLQYYPITNDEMGRRFGGVGGTATGLGANADLEGIMSETELLAREQAQNVHNGAVTGSGTIDLESHREEDGLGLLPGGFQKTKSWSSSSKWASEQRYGADGKPKTYSMLSTAESEKHNINGKTTGYKAATTTLEDDGKVSTYSLHTA